MQASIWEYIGQNTTIFSHVMLNRLYHTSLIITLLMLLWPFSLGASAISSDNLKLLSKAVKSLPTMMFTSIGIRPKLTH